jgi:light-regulated signal transduction histidine kinase (bacteriophytochrome)
MRGRIVTALAASRAAEQEVREQALELEQQADDLRRSNDELEQFAYVASHDLQEPLRKVASFCQMLQRRYSGQLDEKADQYIEFAVDGAKRMQQLINDLLLFSRVGRTSEGMTTVNTATAAGHAVTALAAAREQAHAQVDIGELPKLTGDQTLLTQLFQNLIGNAIKFRAPGRAPRVELRAMRDDEFWHFTCADNGIGIDPEYAERVFVIFQRLHPKDQYTGTGIGLSLCKKIVEYHGGRIWLDTERPADAVGAVVHWTLPV